jgi:hypothetical protein
MVQSYLLLQAVAAGVAAAVAAVLVHVLVAPVLALVPAAADKNEKSKIKDEFQYP